MKPDSRYNKKPLDWFIGRGVKIAFQSANSKVEHMWVQITHRDGDNLVGTLDNVPIVVEGINCGDSVLVKRVEIEAVSLSYEEWNDELNELLEEGDILPYPAHVDGLEEAFEDGWTPRQALRWWNLRHAISDLED